MPDLGPHQQTARRLAVHSRGKGWPARITVSILLVAGFFDAISGNPVDAILLGAVAGLLAVSPPTELPTRAEPSLRSRPRLIVLFGVLAVAYATLAGILERYTWPLTIAILLPGVAAITIAWRGIRRRDPGLPLRFPQIAPWLALALVLAGFELVNLFLQPGLTIDSFDHPTLSVLWEATDSGIGESLALLAWLGLGLYLLDR